MRWAIGIGVLLLHWTLAGSCQAQFGRRPQTGKGVSFGAQTTQRWRVGVEITAVGGPLTNVYATFPVPIDWPEQQVRVDKEEVPPGARTGHRILHNSVKQRWVFIPSIPAGGTAKTLITFEVTKAAVNAPPDPRVFRAPKRAARTVRRHLAQSPFIESRNGKIRKLARELTAEHDHVWDQVESIYDWVRKNIKYKDGKLKGALAALRDRTGDCEELTSLFIALCRAKRIPARTVWVPGHCYPEFFLEDDEGKGHWIPCQAAGTRAFGSIPDNRPILQKGDNFKVPEKRKAQRYVAEFLEVRGFRGGVPKVRFVRQLLPAGM